MRTLNKKIPVNEKVNALEKAKQVIAEAEQAKLEEAVKEFNEFKSAWVEKHGVDLIVVGQFSGSQIQSGIQIIKTK